MSFDSDSASPSDSGKSKKSVTWSNDKPMEESKPPSPRNSITSTTSSRTCASPTQKPVDTLSPTKTIEEYVRSEAHGRGLSEEALQEVIQSLMEEQANNVKEQEKQALMAATDGCQTATGSHTGGSQNGNGSVARNCSVKSV